VRRGAAPPGGLVANTRSADAIDRRATPGPIHVLTYHKIDTRPDIGINTVSPRRFERHLTTLLSLGLQPLDMPSVIRVAAEGVARQDAGVHITFDDGYQDFLDHAWPLCVRHGFPATVFPVAAYVGRRNTWDLSFPRTSHLTWAGLRELSDAGVTVGAHTETHPFLSRIPLEHARAEIVDSKARLEDGIGRGVSVFAYPHGDSSPSLARLVEDAGYSAAFSLDPSVPMGPTTRWQSPRTAVYALDGARGIAAKVGRRGTGPMRRAWAINRLFRRCGYAGLLVPGRRGPSRIVEEDGVCGTGR
jgi:peptidoglycan/xylan/chitin deacetylase (PgdA/CDA1 family)